MHINFEWDEDKRRANLEKHGVDFNAAQGFDMGTAVLFLDDRYAYGEVRTQALGYINTRLHVLVFTERESALRIISLRKANKRELRLWNANRLNEPSMR